MPGTKALSPVILLCIARAAAAPRPPEALATSSLVVLTAARLVTRHAAQPLAEPAIPLPRARRRQTGAKRSATVVIVTSRCPSA